MFAPIPTRCLTICTRLFILLTSEGYEPAKSHTENLVSFMLSKVIPNDLQTSLYMDLTKNGSDPIKEMLRDKRLATKLLKGM